MRCKELDGLQGHAQQAVAAGDARVLAARDRRVLDTGDVGAELAGGFDAGGAGQHQVRLCQLGEPTGFDIGGTIALDRIVLLLQRLGDLGLVIALLGFVLLRFLRAGIVQIAGFDQTLTGLATVEQMGLCVGACFGRDEQPLRRPDGAVGIGAQFKSFAACVQPACIAVDARDMAQAQ
ncbi:hypothetical protein D3C87_1154070 [compost metagenome]